jgi:protein-tyrosine-phosphatase
MISNPPLPSEVRSILFVCKGNICRSPFAALLATRLARQGGSGVTCASAGLVPSTDGQCPEDAVTAAARYGVSLAGHVPAALTTELAFAHDLVVVMETGQLAEVRRRWPALTPRVVLLAPFDGEAATDAYSKLNVSDPFGKGPAAFDACYTRVEASIRRLLGDLRPAAGELPRGVGRTVPSHTSEVR